MLFDEAEKKIFCYELGGVKVYTDPLELRRKLIRAGAGEVDEVIERSYSEIDLKNPVAVLSHQDDQERRIAMVREAFGLATINPKTGEGVSEEDALRILTDFLGWVEKNERWAAN